VLTTSKKYESKLTCFCSLFYQSLLLTPDQAALHHGISRTDLVIRLQDLSDTLVSEANRADEDNDIAGPCMEALLEGDCECRHCVDRKLPF